MKNNNQGSAGGAYPIANEIPYDTANTPPLTGGTLYADKKVLEQMPFNMGNKSQAMDSVDTSKSCDNGFNPNLFGSWIDIYDAWMGTYTLVTAPKGLKRHEQLIKHLLFLSARFAVLKVDNDRFLIGNYGAEQVDEYGRITKGTFTRWNSGTNNYDTDKKKIININESNKDLIVTMKLGEYTIPLFLSIAYFVNMRNILWQFKNVNLRLATLHKIVGTDSGGQEILVPFLKDLFNLNSSHFPNPIQIIDIASNPKNGDLSFNFKDLNKQIDLDISYKGNEINIDIETVTKELFRVAGIRSDMVQQSGKYQERATTGQVQQSSTYFTARERQVLNYFDNFAYDWQEKFKETIKWDCIYNVEVMKEKESENEKKEGVKNDRDL